jgi:hypothetical protein
MERFRRLDKAGKTGGDFGFVLPNEDTFRFCQRYRVSKSFEGIQLAGYSDATIIGYTGLFKILLTWSAFERFLKITGQTQAQFGPLLATYDAETAIEKIRAIDKGGKFYLFLAGEVNATHQHELLSIFSGSRSTLVIWLLLCGTSSLTDRSPHMLTRQLRARSNK